MSLLDDVIEFDEETDGVADDSVEEVDDDCNCSLFVLLVDWFGLAGVFFG